MNSATIVQKLWSYCNMLRLRPCATATAGPDGRWRADGYMDLIAQTAIQQVLRQGKRSAPAGQSGPARV